MIAADFIHSHHRLVFTYDVIISVEQRRIRLSYGIHHFQLHFIKNLIGKFTAKSSSGFKVALNHC